MEPLALSSATFTQDWDSQKDYEGKVAPIAHVQTLFLSIRDLYGRLYSDLLRGDSCLQPAVGPHCPRLTSSPSALPSKALMTQLPSTLFHSSHTEATESRMTLCSVIQSGPHSRMEGSSMNNYAGTPCIDWSVLNTPEPVVTLAKPGSFAAWFEHVLIIFFLISPLSTWQSPTHPLRQDKTTILFEVKPTFLPRDRFNYSLLCIQKVWLISLLHVVLDQGLDIGICWCLGTDNSLL